MRCVDGEWHKDEELDFLCKASASRADHLAIAVPVVRALIQSKAVENRA